MADLASALTAASEADLSGEGSPDKDTEAADDQQLRTTAEESQKPSEDDIAKDEEAEK